MVDRRATRNARALGSCTLALVLARAACGADAPPPVSAAERAAAFPDVSGMPMHAHMDEDPLTWMFKAEELEWQDRSGGDASRWDVTGWIGYDVNRLWLRDEGDHTAGEQASNQLELLWGHPLGAWWDLLAGVRQDTGAGPSRTYAAIGVQGLAPQWFHVEATAYAGEGGQAGAGLQVDYDWLLTNRLILTARGEADAWSDDDPDNGIGSGLSEIRTGLRLRYEIRREFAPYAGVEWEGLFGDTADIARSEGRDRRDTRLVAGLRFWF